MELFFFMHDYPRPGEKWKHFKGHVYEIICLAGVPGYPRTQTHLGAATTHVHERSGP